MPARRIFISYAHSDFAAAAFIRAGLQRVGGIEASIDVDWEVEDQKGWRVLDQLEEADALVLLVSGQSMASVWVGNEVGFALGRGIPVFPLALTTDVPMRGLLTLEQSTLLLDWRSPDAAVENLARALRAAPARPPGGPRAEGNRARPRLLGARLDRVITGRTERTELIAKELYDLPPTGPGVVARTSLSPFSFPDDPDFAELAEFDAKYFEAVRRERDAAQKFIDGGGEFRMLLCPEISSTFSELGWRLQALVSWLRENRHRKNVHVRVGTHDPRMVCAVIGNRCAVEGTKAAVSSGYDVSVFWYNEDRILEHRRQIEDGLAAGLELTEEWLDSMERRAALARKKP